MDAFVRRFNRWSWINYITGAAARQIVAVCIAIGAVIIAIGNGSEALNYTREFLSSIYHTVYPFASNKLDIKFLAADNNALYLKLINNSRNEATVISAEFKTNALDITNNVAELAANSGYLTDIEIANIRSAAKEGNVKLPVAKTYLEKTQGPIVINPRSDAIFGFTIGQGPFSLGDVTVLAAAGTCTIYITWQIENEPEKQDEITQPCMKLGRALRTFVNRD